MLALRGDDLQGIENINQGDNITINNLHVIVTYFSRLIELLVTKVFTFISLESGNNV